MTGIALEVQLNGGASLSGSFHKHGAVGAADELVLGVDDAGGLAVLEAQDLHSVGIGDHTQLLTVQLSGDGIAGVQPHVAPLFAPLGAGDDLGHLLGHGGLAQMLRGVVSVDLVGSADGSENVSSIQLQHSFNFFVGSLNVLVVVHDAHPFLKNFGMEIIFPAGQSPGKGNKVRKLSH